MSKNLTLLFILMFGFSCSLFEQTQTDVQKRDLASIIAFEDVLVLEEDENFQVKGSIRVYGKRDGYNSFSFPLLTLESPFYYNVPYIIHVSTHNVKCVHSENIERVGSNNTFSVKNYTYGDFLKCAYTERGEGFFNFIYEIPKIQPFAVSEAEYMKGFTPDIVSNMELRLAKIYEKLVPPPGQKAKPLFYRERELLLKYIPDIINVTFEAKKNEIQFETTIEKEDLFHIRNISGTIEHRKFGVTNHEGFLTDDYYKYKAAGSKYLIPYGLKPYALYCNHESMVYDFEYADEKTFSDPGKIQCSLNSRSPHFLGFKPAKGEVTAEITILRVAKAKKLLPKYYLNKAKNAIEKEIASMNANNQKRFKNRIEKEIDFHEKNIVDMLIVDKDFPYRTMVKAKEIKKVVLLKPIIRYETVAGKDYRYLSYKVFLRSVYEDQFGSQFQSSDIYMNELKTKMIITKDHELKNFSKVYSVNPADYYDGVKPYLENYFDKEKVIPYSAMEVYFEKLASRHRYSPKKSQLMEIELSRFSLAICGNIVPAYDTAGKKVEEVHLKDIRAKYDLEEGANISSFRTMYSDHYYFEKKNLESEIIVKTPIPYSSLESSKEQCYFMTPAEYADKNYGADLIFREI